MRRSAEISGRLRVDRKQFTADLSAARTEAERFSVAMRHFARPSLGGGGSGGGPGFWTEMHSKIQLAGGALRTAAGAAKSFFSAETDLEGLARGLAAVSDGTESIKDQISALVTLAESPGVGSLDTAGQASIQLQAVGMSAKESRAAIKAFANEAAGMNLPQEGLKEVIVSLRQMAKTQVDMENLKEIFSRLPRVADLVQGLDKSNPLQFIKALTAELEKQPKAIAGTKEKVDELADSWKRWRAEAFGGAVSEATSRLAKAGSNALKGNFLGAIDSFVSAGDVVTGQDAVPSPVKRFEVTPEEAKRRQEAAAARARENARIQEENAQKEMNLRREIVRLQNNIEDARRTGDDEHLKKFEDELAVLMQAKGLAKDLSISEERAAAFIEEQNQARRDAEKKTEEFLAKKEKEKMLEQQLIDTLRAQGREKEAQKKEDERRARDLMNGPAKMSQEEANAFIAQDKANGRNTGRRRIRGARFRKDTSGLGKSTTGSNIDEWDRHRDETNFNPGSGFTKESGPSPLDIYHPEKQNGKKAQADQNVAQKVKNQPGQSGGTDAVVDAMRTLELAMRDVEKAVRETRTTKTRIA